MPAADSIRAEARFGESSPALPTGQRPGILARLFVPDLALAAAIALLCLMAMRGGTGLFRDSDSGWHIRTGERILATGSLPVVDSFSFSRPGQPWTAWEWGADVISGLAHRAAGLRGVALVYGFAIAASVWMWFRLTFAVGGNFVLACLFVAPMLSTTNFHWFARPHVFSWLFLLGTVWFCERMPRRLGGVRFATIAFASAVWANVHGSFVLAPVIVLLYAAGNWLRFFLWEDEAPAPLAPYVQTAVALILGSLVNPHGWLLHRNILFYLSDPALLDHIAEFQSFNYHADGAAQILLALGFAAVGGVAAVSARRPERFLIAAMFLGGALRSARILPLVALLLLPLANASLCHVFASAGGLNVRVRTALERMLTYGDNLRRLDSARTGYALIPVIAVVAFIAMDGRVGFPPDMFPVAAASAVAALPSDARILAPDKFGGYLIYRFAGERKVFFDGRSDFYGADFVKKYSLMMEARPGWSAEFARWHFTHVLVPPDEPLTAALITAGWTELYRDKTAVLLMPHR